jgi:16S rRNA (uracil1498-N3)-methyltransferase
MPRYFVDQALPQAGTFRLEGEAGHRAARVMRLRTGDAIHLFDGSGREVAATIHRVAGGTVTVEIEAELPPEPPGPDLLLYPALIRSNRFEWLIEKATELGVAAIRPIITARCQVQPSEIRAGRSGRWRRIAVEAAEQCGRRTMPEIASPCAFDAALAAAGLPVLFPYEDSRTTSLPAGAALRDFAVHHGVPPVLSIFIGPEGGFAGSEAGTAGSSGALVVSLGARVLRSETAAIAALAIARDTLDSMTREGR